jgi:hypothetical protein
MASRNTSCPFQRAIVATSPIRTVPSGAGGSDESESRSSVGPFGVHVATSIPLYTTRILAVGPSTIRASFATLCEMATAAAVLRGLRRSKRDIILRREA